MSISSPSHRTGVCWPRRAAIRQSACGAARRGRRSRSSRSQHAGLVDSRDRLSSHVAAAGRRRLGAGHAGRQSDARLIHLWELDFDVLLGQPAAPTVTYTSAKVVLVGESNVGKSYLAHRIATGAPPEQGTIESTHGMKFWPLEPEKPSPAAQSPTEKPGLPSAFAEKLFGQAAAVSKNQRGVPC